MQKVEYDQLGGLRDYTGRGGLLARETGQSLVVFTQMRSPVYVAAIATFTATITVSTASFTFAAIVAASFVAAAQPDGDCLHFAAIRGFSIAFLKDAEGRLLLAGACSCLPGPRRTLWTSHMERGLCGHRHVEGHSGGPVCPRESDAPEDATYVSYPRSNPYLTAAVSSLTPPQHLYAPRSSRIAIHQEFFAVSSAAPRCSLRCRFNQRLVGGRCFRRRCPPTAAVAQARQG